MLSEHRLGAVRERAAGPGVVLGVAGLVLAGAWIGGLRVVTSPSVPMGFYLIDEDFIRVERGDYVCMLPGSAEAPEALQREVREGWVPASWASTALMKVAVGFEGDVVRHDLEDGIGVLRVAGAAHYGTMILDTDSRGHRLPHVEFPVVLGRDQVWLHSEHPYGYDSRYFGPVDFEAIECVGTPLWLF